MLIHIFELPNWICGDVVWRGGGDLKRKRFAMSRKHVCQLNPAHSSGKGDEGKAE